MDPTAEYAPSCELVPGAGRGGPGWYLQSQHNLMVECGPFPTEAAAILAGLELDEQGRGVNPQLWEPVYSARGLVVGARRRASRPRKHAHAA